MENASKALLIAASVLIVILLIAMGMKLFNTTTGTSDQIEGTMNSTEITTFNNQFVSFVGTNKSRAHVVSLLNAVIVNNSKNPMHQILVNGSDAKTLINSVADTRYTIEIEEIDNDGYVTKMKYY